jgi:beta-glucosidase
VAGAECHGQLVEQGPVEEVLQNPLFDLPIGASAADIRCKATVTLQSTQELPCLLNRESTVREWLEDPRGRPVFEGTYQTLMAQMGAVFGGGDGSGAIGMDMTGFMMEMPLLSLLMFQDGALPMTAEDLVDGLLLQVYGVSQETKTTAPAIQAQANR